MRVGQNPAKSLDGIAQPAPVTVAVVTYIPFLEGYYAEALDVLKACLGSIWENTQQSYDLLVFDNASCGEVRGYLEEEHRQKHIQYLVLSDRNIGKGGAWNFIFNAAPGEYIAYADSDVYFYPGWLEAQLSVFDRFPNVGMVTGAPLRIPKEFSTSTVAWAEQQPDIELQRGRLLPWEDYWQHAHSLGIETEREGRELYDRNQDTVLVHRGERFYVGASHFQFVARKQVLQRMLPLPADRPMGQMRALDGAVNDSGYLRLSTEGWWVRHMGNTLSKTGTAAEGKRDRRTFWQWKPVRKALLWIYSRVFNILYRGS